MYAVQIAEIIVIVFFSIFRIFGYSISSEYSRGNRVRIG